MAEELTDYLKKIDKLTLKKADTTEEVKEIDNDLLEYINSMITKRNEAKRSVCWYH